MVSSDDEGLSQRYLQVVDSNKKIFMPQNRQAAISKCSPIWNKMKKKKKLKYLRLKFKLIPKKKYGKAGISWKRNRTFLMEKELKEKRLVNCFNTSDSYFSGYSDMDVVDFDDVESDNPEITHGSGTLVLDNIEPFWADP